MINTKEDVKAFIFDINRFRIEDGPGIRTIIFFKGCPLNCLWCSNPFGLSPKSQLIYNTNKCILCQACINHCPNHAISFVDDKIVTDKSLCTNCGHCVEDCLYNARTITGKVMKVSEIMNEIVKDEKFYRRNRGGVTLSGGEVLMQSEAAKMILKQCQDRLIDTTIETSGFSKWEIFRDVIPLCDLIFIDLKHIDSNEHKKLTGVPNELILLNIRKAMEYVAIHNSPRIIIRIPVISGLNDSQETMQKTAEFLSGLPGHIEVNLLPYHRLGSDKYAMLGLEYTIPDLEPLSVNNEILNIYRNIIQSIAPNSICNIGGGEISMLRQNS